MKLSIVIATKGRVVLLKQLLESLVITRKKYAGSSEVLLIDDSNDADKKEIMELCRKYDAKLLAGPASVSAKRNYGAKMADGEIILFLDSDCIATENLIEHHMKKYESNKIGAVVGPLEFVGKENRFWKSVALTPYLICFKMPYWGETVPWGTTANFSVRKQVFIKIGGFDEAFPNKPGGEDVDLGLRIVKQGYIIATTKQGLVYHDKATWSKRKQMFQRVWYYGGADYYLVERHPDFVVDSMPRRCLISVLLSVIMIFLSLAKSPIYLVGIFIWVLLDIFGMAFVMSRLGSQKSTFLQQIEVQLMIMVNEIGYIRNCLRFRKIKYLFKQMVYFENQLKGITYNGNIAFWCFFINVIIMICLYCILTTFI